MEVHGGSKAIWPAPVHSYVATDRAAQGRRLFIMTGSEWIAFLRARRNLVRHPLHLLATMPRMQQIYLSCIACSCTLLLVLLTHWQRLFEHRLFFALYGGFCLLLLLVSVALIMKERHLRWWQQQDSHRAQLEASDDTSPASGRAAPVAPFVAGVPGAHLGASLRTSSRQTQQTFALLQTSESEVPPASSQRFRVLETVDLSSLNVPHFIDTTSFKALASAALKHVDTAGHTS